MSKQPFKLDLAIKEVDTQADGSLLIEGYASTYATDRDREAVTPEALRASLKGYLSNPILLLGHDPDKPIGKVISATVDEVGLWIKAEITTPVSDWAKEAFQKIKDGVFKALSIGGIFTRRGENITSIDLAEISVVAIPSNTGSLFEVVQKAFRLDFKAQWTSSYINDLPDSAFLYIETGGEKDEEGKTAPRSLRHFPYKDDSGAIDLPHLRNALARIPQSDLPGSVKDKVSARAQKLLDDNSDAEKTALIEALDGVGAKLDLVTAWFDGKAPAAHTTMKAHFHTHEDGDEHTHAHFHSEGDNSHDPHPRKSLRGLLTRKALPAGETPAVGLYGDCPEGSYEDLREDLQRAVWAQVYGGGGPIMGADWYGAPSAQVLWTMPDDPKAIPDGYCLVAVNDGTDVDYYEVAYSIDPQTGEPVLGESREVALVYTPATPDSDPDEAESGLLQLSYMPADGSAPRSYQLQQRSGFPGGVAGTKVGRTLSKANETTIRAAEEGLMSALELVRKVLDTVQTALDAEDEEPAA